MPLQRPLLRTNFVFLQLKSILTKSTTIKQEKRLKMWTKNGYMEAKFSHLAKFNMATNREFVKHDAKSCTCAGHGAAPLRSHLSSTGCCLQTDTCINQFKGAQSRLNGLKSLAKLFKFVVRNPCQSSPSLTILVHGYFQVIFSMLKNKSKCRD